MTIVKCLDIDLRAVLRSEFSRVHATLSNGHGRTVVVRQRLIIDCTYFYEKAQAITMKQTQSE